MTESYHDVFCRNFFDLVKDGQQQMGTVDDALNKLASYECLLDHYSSLIDDCESPIERILACELLFAIDGYNRIQYAFMAEHEPPPTDDWGTYFFPQAAVGSYRIDFLIVCYVEGKLKKIGIECDGHDYHDRTKEQASRDKQRDRKLLASGIPVYRFTGSDIFRDSKKCLCEIEAVINHALDDLLIAAGKIHDYRRTNG